MVLLHLKIIYGCKFIHSHWFCMVHSLCLRFCLPLWFSQQSRCRNSQLVIILACRCSCIIHNNSITGQLVSQYWLSVVELVVPYQWSRWTFVVDLPPRLVRPSMNMPPPGMRPGMPHGHANIFSAPPSIMKPPMNRSMGQPQQVRLGGLATVTLCSLWTHPYSYDSCKNMANQVEMSRGFVYGFSGLPKMDFWCFCLWEQQS